MYLGKYLSWDMHIKQLSFKLSRVNDILSKLSHNARLDDCLQIYYVYFIPISVTGVVVGV